MALLQCKECGGKVSELAKVCPGCGAPVESGLMRSQPRSEGGVTCALCMSENYDGATVCRFCGAFREEYYGAAVLGSALIWTIASLLVLRAALSAVEAVAGTQPFGPAIVMGALGALAIKLARRAPRPKGVRWVKRV